MQILNDTDILLISGTDKSGACKATYSEFLVDTTPPEIGWLKVGPRYDMVSIGLGYAFFTLLNLFYSIH